MAPCQIPHCERARYGFARALWLLYYRGRETVTRMTAVPTRVEAARWTESLSGG